MSIVVVLVLQRIEYLLFSSIRLSFLHASMLNSLSRRSTLAYTDLFLCLDAVVIDSLSRLRIDYWERQIEQTYASCVYYFLASLSMWYVELVCVIILNRENYRCKIFSKRKCVTTSRYCLCVGETCFLSNSYYKTHSIKRPAGTSPGSVSVLRRFDREKTDSNSVLYGYSRRQLSNHCFT